MFQSPSQKVSTTSCDNGTRWGSCRAPSTCESCVFHCGAQGLWKTRKPPTPLQLASILPSAPSTNDRLPVAQTSGDCSTQLPQSACRVLGLKDAHCVWDIAQNAAVRPRPGHHHGNALSPSFYAQGPLACHALHLAWDCLLSVSVSATEPP